MYYCLVQNVDPPSGSPSGPPFGFLSGTPSGQGVQNMGPDWRGGGPRFVTIN